ncbi:hypothetical protein [Gloeothece verrucosa]|uniref:Uncharacterized protein n=1 Tax=Gloeothece verrucosa (strain PCC 7822) TaxID=497965 RepID=E0UMB9_GLOV7|nr:hypothetical protein [Gloeothece verrucosa]ADN18099.1 hypothetical protein Cyan7822_6299 [Gloeothece verrucosa PCC 7822]
MGKNPNMRLDDYDKQFYDEQGNLLPEWEFPFTLWDDSYSYYPDGTPRPEFKERVWKSDMSSAGVAYALSYREEEVQEWREKEELWQQQFGISRRERIRENYLKQQEEIRNSFKRRK